MNNVVLSTRNIDDFINDVANKVILKLNDHLTQHLRQDDSLELERYITKREAAKIASVSTSTVDNWGREGCLTRHYFGGSVRFWLPELMKFLESKKVV